MSRNIKKQAGNLYLVAIFVIVVMGFLAAALSRIEWSNQDALSRDVLGTQAWFAAHSLNELALTQFYPLNASSAVRSVCADNAALQMTIDGLIAKYPGCSAAVSCRSLGQLDDQSLFQLENRVRCGSGVHQVERAQQVVVKE
ncbi:MSHA biogenesis protein MshP [Vibrio sp. HDW18]|uniref:MSHA biogenesis protein MshP n=1 Tax=Vibrio sp. HDW18 TaxID=2714948 RepID=UPI00140D1A8C|nr:MSHA biogenesis protein MshP [Vibrio sp. HDW18]QIL85221.1 MSHA biogenesis protein MshP [Vibrio sp. HDW18]